MKVLIFLAVFHRGDTVMQFRSHIQYVIDSVMVGPPKSKREIFYHARTLDGTPVNWLPEPAIKLVAIAKQTTNK
jgi:hypothetical protein